MISYEPNYPELSHAASIHNPEGVAARHASAGPISQANAPHALRPRAQARIDAASVRAAAGSRGEGSQTGRGVGGGTDGADVPALL